MSTKSKIALGIAAVSAVAMISYIHLKQEWEREKLHQGVIKDMERQRLKKHEKRLAPATEDKSIHL